MILGQGTRAGSVIRLLPPVDKSRLPDPMQATNDPQRSRTRKRDASNFDDYILAVFSVALVGLLIAL